MLAKDRDNFLLGGQLLDNFDDMLLPGDDIWKKFEFLDNPISSDLNQSQVQNALGFVPEEMEKELESLLEWSLDASSRIEVSEIRHHDCMWAGHCGSKEHKGEVKNPIIPEPVKLPEIKKPVFVKKSPMKPVMMTNSRSILRTKVNPEPVQTVLHTVLPVGRPDSPPSSDDDDHPRFKHEISEIFSANQNSSVNKTLQLLNDAISECDFDDDSDLCEYFDNDNDSDVFGENDGENENDRDSSSHSSSPRSEVTSVSYPGESDHSYHKGKTAQLRMDHLGVQTPSDSEEEIDVVSIGEKTPNPSRMNTVLPTNPSIRDRQKLQRTVACAISNKREFIQPGGIKTRLPLRIPNTNTPPSERTLSTNRKRGGENTTSNNTNRGRGVKRARHHRNSPPKRNARYGHSSDSDTECSEKRSLHNNMERQRRVDLRNAFDDLRQLVPEVACKEKAAKVVILREAASYCYKLTTDSTGMAKQVTELRRQQERLRARVSQLRRSLAAKR